MIETYAVILTTEAGRFRTKVTGRDHYTAVLELVNTAIVPCWPVLEPDDGPLVWVITGHIVAVSFDA